MAASKMQPIFSIRCISFQSARCINLHPAVTYKKRTVIEAQFGDALHWERLDNRKASRVKYSQAFEGYNRDNWPEMIAWLVEHIAKLEQAFKKPLAEINKELKQTGGETPKAEVQLSAVEESDVLA
jgi:hypothetical protein